MKKETAEPRAGSQSGAANRLVRMTRRQLLLAGIAGTAVLGVGAYGGFRLVRRELRRRRKVPPREQAFAPDPLVAIDETGLVTLWLTKTDMGQGVATALPMIIADELGADPARLRIVLAPLDSAYGDAQQLTGVSTSVRGMFAELRTAGAAAREMLVAAGAATLGVPERSCRASMGHVEHPESGRRLPFGSLVRTAARLSVPTRPALRPLQELAYVGKAMPRLDLPAKIDGSARFGIDVRVTGMAFAVVARCPTAGGKATAFEAAAAKSVPGVLAVQRIDRGIAVIASNSHAAILGRQALKIEWDRGPNATWNTKAIDAHLDGLLGRDGVVARREGKGAAGLDGPGRLLRAEYRLPYLAHATMEPMNCTADVRDDGCTIWAPTQAPTRARDSAARRLGLPADKVAVHVTLAGGGFGRRVEDDFALEAVDLSRALRRPVQVLWTRDDDLQHDWFRPCSAHRLEARLGSDGALLAWRHRIAAPSILRRDPNFRAEVDPTAVEGAQELPYRIPDLQVEYLRADLPMQVGFWRSVGHSYNAFAVECFIDEIAAAAGKDPAALRRALLAGAPRHLAVLEAALAKAGPRPTAAGSGRGIAVHASYGSYVAMVADVAARADGSIRAQRFVCAVDCGYAVHPDGVAAQIEGGVAFGLGAALHGRIDVEAGAPVQSNFHDYPLLKIGEMPAVEVQIVNGAPDGLGGVGEIGVPPAAPAFCNAIFAATGRRVRTLPLQGG
jgi:isoquinoline 1-oxidoreductase beta subunit